jgi:hypothetical protein
MAEIVNLRRARKRKTRAAAESAADANRLKHGVAKTERYRARAEQERLRRDGDSKKLDSGE